MKVFEKVVRGQVSHFLDSNRIISNSQSGFRNNHSTDTAVLCVSDYILEELSKGCYVGAVLVDLKKAFDTVDHKILLKKLFCYGFRESSLDWFQSYLNHRFQCSTVEGTLSSLIEEDQFGVPQGSVLGPLLFLLYINDIFSCIDSKLTFSHLYADDTIIIQSTRNKNDLKIGLENQLKGISKWFYQNKLSVNTSKTEVIFFGNKKRVQECKDLPPVVMQEINIECKSNVKYLGIIFDENMSWKNQANHSRKKAYHSLHKIRKIMQFLENTMVFLLLNALVLPHNNYRLPHINYCLNTSVNIKKFDVLFRQIDKFHPLNRSITQLINYNKAVMVFKGIHKLCPSYISDRLHLVQHQHHHRTRAATRNNLITARPANKFASRTFIKSSSTIWNDLPSTLKTTNSLVSFKSLAKKHFFPL